MEFKYDSNKMNTKLEEQSSLSGDEQREEADTAEHQNEEKQKAESASEEGEPASTPSEPEKGDDDNETPETKGTSELSSETEGPAVKEDSGEADREDESDEKTKSASKLEAEALSASLSSSRCLLKRNREDLESDSDDDDKEEEPDSKKSHKAVQDEEQKKEKSEEKDEEEDSPVVVSASKLSSSELVASMSSSKSVLKRGIEQVEHTSCKEPEIKVKKSSLMTETSPITRESSNSHQGEANGSSSPINVKSPKTTDRQIFNVKSPVIPVSPLRLEGSSLLESSRLKSPLRVSEEGAERVTPSKSLQSPKESVRVIAAKDLEEDRKLERKRLNKMLLIFSDQKPV